MPTDYDSLMSGAPPPKINGANYDALMGNAPSTALAGAQGTKPQNAADALKLAPTSGVPPVAIMTNPAPVKDMDTLRNAVSISNTNPAMARWATSNPVHVAASQDQFGFLDGLSKAFGVLDKFFRVQPGEQAPEEGFWPEYKREAGALFSDVWNAHFNEKANLEAYVQGHPDDPISKQYAENPDAVLARFRTPGQDIPSQVFAAAGSVAQAPFVLSGVQPALTAGPGAALEALTGVRRQITGNILTFLLPLAKGPLKALKDFIPKPEEPVAPAGLDQPGTIEGTFREVKPGEAEQANAEQNATVMDAFHEVVSKSELQERSPETMAAFIAQQVQGTPVAELKINAQHAVEAYQAAGLVPHPKDGFLGWVPDLQEQLAAALPTGSDIRVPTDGYMTNVSDEGHAALREGLSFADQPSLREADTLAKKSVPVFEGVSFADNPPEGQDSADVSSQSGLVVARKLPSGEVIIGKKGDIHSDLIKEGETPGAEEAGFATPQGHFLSRDEAKQYLEIEPKLKEVTPAIKEAVDRAKNEAYLSLLFKDAKAAGMTEGQFKLYSQKLEALDAKIYGKMHDLVSKQIERERGDAWKARAAQIEPGVRTELGSRPDYSVRHFLATGALPDGRTPTVGPVKLDRAEAKSLVPDVFENLPRAIFGAQGVGADDLAEVFGFRNGESLFRAVDNLELLRKTASQIAGKSLSIPEHFERVVRLETARRVNGELGDFLSPESIDAEARAAVQIPEVQRLLTDELQALAKQVGLPFDKATLDAKAAEAFENLEVRDARNIRALERLVGRNGREAEVALLKGKLPEAFKAKQAQLLNNKMLDLAHKFIKELGRFNKNVKHWAGEKTIPSMDQEYLNYIHGILDEMTYPIARDLQELSSSFGGKTLETFINEKAGQGYELYPTAIPRVKAVDLKVNQFHEVKDLLDSLAHAGRMEQQIVIHNGKMEFADAVNRARDQFADRPEKKTLGELVDNSKTYQGLRVRMRNAFQNVVAVGRVMEFMVDDLDAGSIHGIYNEAAMRPMQDAWYNRAKELRNFADFLAKFTDNAPKEFSKALDRGVSVPLPFKDIHGEEILPIGLKKNLLSAALYYGSDSGRMKLMQGFGWNEMHERRLLDAFEQYLTEDDFKWLEHMWGYGEETWPKIEAFTRKMSGVASTKTNALPFEVQGRTLSGGYAPIVYDKELTPFAAKDQPGGNANDLYGPGYTRATTARGYTKSRTGYTGPLDLDPSHLYSHYLQAIHDMTTREAIMSTQKFLTNQDVSAIIRKSLGNGYYKQMQPWLKRLAGSMNANMDELEGLGRLTELGRHMIISSNLAYHVSTVWIHGTTAAAKSLQDLGWQGINRATQLFLDDPKGFVKFGLDNSEFLKSRKVDRDQSHAEQFSRMTKAQGPVSDFIEKAQDVGFSLLRASDNVSAHLQWRGAYEDAMADPNIADHDDAVYYADKAVRTAHGSGQEIDLPTLLGTKSPWVRSFTGFMTSRMNSVNRIWSSKNWQQLLVNMLTTVGVSAAAYTAIHRNKNKSLLTDVLENGVGEGLGYIPILSGAVYAFEHNDKVQASLIDDMIQIGVDLATDVTKEIRGKHAPIIQDVLRASGVATGGVSGALARPVQYWWDLASGYRHNDGLFSFVKGTLFGPPPKGK